MGSDGFKRPTFSLTTSVAAPPQSYGCPVCSAARQAIYSSKRRQESLFEVEIDYIVCPDYIEDKLLSKHNLTAQEARQVLLSKPRIRFAEKGHVGCTAYG